MISKYRKIVVLWKVKRAYTAFQKIFTSLWEDKFRILVPQWRGIRFSIEQVIRWSLQRHLLLRMMTLKNILMHSANTMKNFRWSLNPKATCMTCRNLLYYSRSLIMHSWIVKRSCKDLWKTKIHSALVVSDDGNFFLFLCWKIKRKTLNNVSSQ